MSTTSKMRGRVKKTGKALTFALLQAAIDYFEFFEAAKNHRRLLTSQGLEGVRRVKLLMRRRQFTEKLYALRRRGLLKQRKIGDRLRYSLTEKGRISYLKMLIAQAPLRKDRKMTLVIFDVPEREKSARGSLRHFLKTSGFIRLQWSVWETRKDVVEALHQWVRLKNLQNWITVLLAEKA